MMGPEGFLNAGVVSVTIKTMITILILLQSSIGGTITKMSPVILGFDFEHACNF